MDSLEVRGPHLIVGRTVKLQRAAMPRYLEQIWRRAIAHAGLRCRPHFFTVRSLEGAGGLYIPGAVVVGLEDLHNLTEGLTSAGNFREVSEAEARWYRRHAPWQLITPKQRQRAAAEHLVHHELGHALADQWGCSLEGPAEEAQADTIAGRFAACVGSHRELGQAFFRAIGCEGAYCSHPSPGDRVRAFEQGYAMECRQVAGAGW